MPVVLIELSQFYYVENEVRRMFTLIRNKEKIKDKSRFYSSLRTGFFVIMSLPSFSIVS